MKGLILIGILWAMVAGGCTATIGYGLSADETHVIRAGVSKP